MDVRFKEHLWRSSSCNWGSRFFCVEEKRLIDLTGAIVSYYFISATTNHKKGSFLSELFLY